MATLLEQQQTAAARAVEHKYRTLRLATVAQIAKLPEYRELYTESALRALIFKAESKYSASGKSVKGNGLLEIGAIIRIGRKVMIDLDRFDDWLLNHRAVSQGQW